MYVGCCISIKVGDRMNISLNKRVKVTSGKNSEKEKILKSVRFILDKNSLFTISTLDVRTKNPCSSSAYYSFDDDLNLYFWTDPNAKHSKNIEKNSNVAVNIFDSHQAWGSLLKGVQMRGVARVVTKKELLIGGALYLKRFPNVSQYVKKILDFHSKKFQSKMYKIEPTWIKLFDEELFGKEGWREISFL